LGSLLADLAEASHVHRSAEPGPPMLASLDCKHPGVCPFWHGALSVDGDLFGAWPLSADKRRQMQDKLYGPIDAIDAMFEAWFYIATSLSTFLTGI